MNILVFGDSITQGFDDTEMGGWVNRLFVNLSARKKFQPHDKYHAVFNLGISGDTTDSLLRRIEIEIAARGDDTLLIIFDIGGNDSVRNLVTNECQVPLAQFRENYQRLISLGKLKGEVVCLGLHDSDESRLNPMPHYKNHAILAEDQKKYDAEIKSLAAKNEVQYIEMSGTLSQNFNELTYDGDHPSAKGHELIFNRVINALQERLEL